MDCCRIGLRHGLVYTVAMMALGLGVSLNLLSLINLLWTLGVLDNPYGSDGTLHPRHYVYALVCLSFITNSVLARIQFSVDSQGLDLMPDNQTPQISVPKFSLIRTPGAMYVLGSAVLFLITVALDLLVRE